MVFQLEVYYMIKYLIGLLLVENYGVSNPLQRQDKSVGLEDNFWVRRKSWIKGYVCNFYRYCQIELHGSCSVYTTPCSVSISLLNIFILADTISEYTIMLTCIIILWIGWVSFIVFKNHAYFFVVFFLMIWRNSLHINAIICVFVERIYFQPNHGLLT